MKTAAHSRILILDFGSQYTQVIARRVRECQVYSQIVRFDMPAAEARGHRRQTASFFPVDPRAFTEKRAADPDPAIFSLGIPVLGICYGMQLMAHHLGGKVELSGRREYGAGLLRINDGSPLFHGLGEHLDIWNSHGDKITKLPAGFRAVGNTDNSPFAAVEDPEAKSLRPAISSRGRRTPRAARRSSRTFVYHICDCEMDWTMGSFIDDACAQVRQQVGDDHVILGLSGGVDSSVAAALLHKAIGDQLTCIFVNNGLLRANEAETVQRVFGDNFHIKLKYVDASRRFLKKLKGVTDPERKRKIIGNEFVRVFRRRGDRSYCEKSKSEISDNEIQVSSRRGRFIPT